MPHKKNPVRAERISGLSRIVRSNLQTALENIALWHERDISHSSAERVIFPDSFILTDYLLAETVDVIGNWKVIPERMSANVNATKGLVFSQAVMLAMTEKGISREEAYRLVQTNSLKAWDENRNFIDLLLIDDEVLQHLDEKEIRACFSMDPYLNKIDMIFDRVLSDEN